MFYTHLLFYVFTKDTELTSIINNIYLVSSKVRVNKKIHDTSHWNLINNFLKWIKSVFDYKQLNNQKFIFKRYLNT